MNKRFQLIVFDWDGTLMDSEARIVACLRAAAEDCKAPDKTDLELKNIIGLGLREAIHTLYPNYDTRSAEDHADRYRYHYLQQDKTHSPLFPGVKDMLQTLREHGYWLAVATGKGRQGLDKVLDETSLHDHFLTTRCASETFSKPHPQMLLEIMDELGVNAQNTLMIGDTEYDMQLANNAGAESLAVCYGVHSADRLLKHNPLDCINDISRLPGWLENHATTNQ